MEINFQNDTLTGDLASLDVSTPKNLANLVKLGEEMLDYPVSRMNLTTGKMEPVVGLGTNREALKK